MRNAVNKKFSSNWNFTDAHTRICSRQQIKHMRSSYTQLFLTHSNLKYESHFTTSNFFSVWRKQRCSRFAFGDVPFWFILHSILMQIFVYIAHLLCTLSFSICLSRFQTFSIWVCSCCFEQQRWLILKRKTKNNNKNAITFALCVYKILSTDACHPHKSVTEKRERAPTLVQCFFSSLS